MPATPTLVVSHDIARLADAVAEVLAGPREDPFVDDVICCPAGGFQRWLGQRLSRRLGANDGCADGVAAGLAFHTPAGLIRHLKAELVGEDPFTLDRLTDEVLAVCEENEEPWAALLRRRLDPAEPRPGQRVETARRIAARLQEAITWYPTMAQAWRHGEAVDPSGRPLPGDLVWQATLLARIVERAGVSPGALDADLVDRLASSSLLGQGRWVVVCPREVAPVFLQTMERVSCERPVFLFLRPQPASAAPIDPRVRRWRSRESAVMEALSQLHPTVRPLDEPAPRPTLLGNLHRLLRGESPLPRPIAPSNSDDSSVQIHLCAGAERHVDLLRDLLVRLLDEDETLEPRDIAVLTPAPERFRALIDAAFGPSGEEGDAHPARSLRVRPARSVMSNPFIDVILDVAAMVAGRARATDLLSLCSSAPVRAAFGFSATDLDRLRDITAQAGIRWGIDGRTRESFGLGPLPHNTWQTGLARMTLGVAVSEDDLAWRGTTLPLGQATSDQISLIAAFSTIVTRCRAFADEAVDATAGQWAERFHRLLDGLTAATADQTGARADAFDLVAEWGESSGTTPWTLSEAAASLARAAASRGPRSRLLSGDLTVASLDDLRLVPHRVICLIGLDSSFPARSSVDGDDPARRQPSPLAPQAPAEDRQRFYDAVTSAQETLIVIAETTDPRTGEQRSAPGPVRDLVALLAQITGDSDKPSPTASSSRGEAPAHPSLGSAPSATVGEASFIHHHPLQRHARACVPRLARVSALPRVETEPPEAFDLADLHTLYATPARAFLRRWTGLTPGALEPTDTATDDTLPLEPDALARWSITERMVRLLSSGADPATIVQAELRRGTVPPGAPGIALAQACQGDALAVTEAARPYQVDPPQWRGIEFTDPAGRHLSGEIMTRGSVLLDVRASKIRAPHQIPAWISLLALAAVQPEIDWRAVLIGRGSRVTLTPPPPKTAAETLAAILEDAASHWGEIPAPPPGAAMLTAWFRRRQLTPDSAAIERAWRQEWERDPAWRLLLPEPAALDLTDDDRSAQIDILHVPLIRGGGMR
ncbi:MAG: exodeoxyribonuclease V subunit gamma [Propionibacteriaceae bacterium]|jgi:exodeoxyribonuclease V gamma subunit|nr:exodeoxyribonuclease V subunit gamma [Propionibacteriaceae bacterium]